MKNQNGEKINKSYHKVGFYFLINLVIIHMIPYTCSSAKFKIIKQILGLKNIASVSVTKTLRQFSLSVYGNY